MARPREFDVETVLREAMQVFWEKGFDGTSFADIEERTGVKKASLFAAYGDKRTLFMKALTSYHEAGLAAAREALGKGSPKEAIRKWLQKGVVGGAAEGCNRRGCFGVNSVVERALRDSDVLSLTREHVDRLVAIVGEAIERGQRDGEFRTDVSARLLASYLVTAAQGLSVAAKAGMSFEDVDGVATIALSALES